MRVRVGFSYQRPELFRSMRFEESEAVQATHVVRRLYDTVMGGKTIGRPRKGGPIEKPLFSARDGILWPDDDGQPVDTQLLELSVGGTVVAHWGWLLDGDVVTVRRRPYELAPLQPFVAQARVDDLRNIEAFVTRMEMVALWEERHHKVMARKAAEPPPGVKKRIMARGIPQISLRKAVTEEELDRAMVNPIGGALVVMKTHAENMEEHARGEGYRYRPVT